MVRLMRPLSLLGASHLLRFGFALGCIEVSRSAGGWALSVESASRRGVRWQVQVHAEEEGAAEEERSKLQGQLGLVPFVKRCLILHASKLVALLAFAAAMQGQSATGWLLLGQPLASGTKAALCCPVRQRHPSFCATQQTEIARRPGCSRAGLERAAPGRPPVVDPAAATTAAGRSGLRGPAGGGVDACAVLFPGEQLSSLCRPAAPSSPSGPCAGEGGRTA